MSHFIKGSKFLTNTHDSLLAQSIAGDSILQEGAILTSAERLIGIFEIISGEEN